MHHHRRANIVGSRIYRVVYCVVPLRASQIGTPQLFLKELVILVSPLFFNLYVNSIVLIYVQLIPKRLHWIPGIGDILSAAGGQSGARLEIYFAL